jgi:hypothetical protein
MANQFSVNAYQINSQDPLPLANVTKIGFPAAGVLIRVANDASGNPGILLSTGVRCYGNIQVIATGTQYLAQENQATLVIAAG